MRSFSVLLFSLMLCLCLSTAAHATGEVRTLAGLKTAPEEFESEIEVDWQLQPEVWGQGLATEGAGEALAKGFDHLDTDEILAFVQPVNVASVRVTSKLGMTYKGSVFDSDLERDINIYAISRGID